MPDYESMSSDVEKEREIGPKEGEAVDEVPGMTEEELEKAHQDETAKEKAEEAEEQE